MSNPNKQRGTRFETACIDYVRAHGFPHAERRTLSGGKDKGDLNMAPGLVVVVVAPTPCCTDSWDNEDGPRGAGNTAEGLTRSLDLDKEGLP